MISFDPSVLTAYYQAKLGLVAAGVTGSGASGSSTGTSAKMAPAAPWQAAKPTSDPDLAKAVMNGASFINPSANKVTGTSSNSDYSNLFALYTGLQSLQSVAEQMQSPGVSSFQASQLQATFARGMSQVESFLGSNPFKSFQVAQGSIGASESTSSGVPEETDTYTTRPLVTGTLDSLPAAFQGAVQFSMNVAKLDGTSATVNFDLSEMGSTPRTMSNVVTYLNGKLKAAGVTTRFANDRIPAASQTITAGGSTVTLPAGQDQFALQLTSDGTETISFSAPVQTPAVYVAQSMGQTSGSTPDAVQQLLKFDTDPTASGSTTVASGRDFADTLGSTTTAVQATVTDGQGSVYVLADVDGKTDDGQAIKGAQDVALMKYDSTGKLLYTRTLGAADSASGYGLALSPDGTQVAVTGSVTGELDSNDSLSTTASSTSSFVSVYSTDGGDELWTQRFGSGTDNQANSVAFGADGTVYVAGTTQSANSANSQAYLSAFSAHEVTVPGSDPTWVAAQTFTSQFGAGTGVNRATGVAVDGSTVVVSSVENGHAVLRSYDTQPGSEPTAATVRDLGDLQGGNLSGVTVNSDGSIVVAGSTHNAALNAGQVTTAYAGGESAFVASLSPDLNPASTDRLTYLGTGANQTASALTVSNGQVFVAGTVAAAGGSGQTSGTQGYIAQVDPTTGAIGWSQQYSGNDNQVAPTSVAVDASGASVLDRLGLPTGTIDFAPSQSLVSNTSLRPGDEFFVQQGASGAKMAVTIDANDTLQTLATKIERASGFTLTAEVLPSNGVEKLTLSPVNSRTQVEIVAGSAGRDALQSLGLAEGVISDAANAPSSSSSSSTKKTSSTAALYGLQLPSTLSLDNATDVKHAIAVLANSVVTVRKIYADMTTPPPSPASASSGTVPAYITAQIANYQQALQRLTGSSS